MATNQEIAARAQELYVAYYGRPADPDGLDFWTGQFTRTDDVSRALASFGASAEYRAIVTAANNDRDVLINQLYQYMFNRDADAEGLMFYRGQLERGEATLASIALDIANGARAGSDDRAILDNKIEVANAFTDRVEREDAPYTRANIRSARELLEAVDETEASVTSAQASIRALVDGLNGVIELTEDNPTANYSAYSVPVTVTLNGDEDETEFAVTGSAFGDTFILEEYLRANISGGGGIDTVDFSEAEGDYTINLGIGTFSADIDDDNLPDFSGTLGSIESVIGSDQADSIHGGDGNERIDGGGGADTLRGGAGDDTFVYADDSDLPAEEVVDGQTGDDDVIEFTGNAIDLTAIDSKNVMNVESLLLSNLGGRSAVTLELDDTNGFGPGDFNLITGSDTVDTLRIGGDADFSSTEVNGIEIFSVSADNLKVQANTLDDVVTLLGPDNAGSTITATARGVYDLSGTSISGWNLLAGTASQAGEIWVLNQAQIDSLLDSKDTRLFGDGMVDKSTNRIANDALRASGSLDLTRVTTDADGATAGLNVYEINFASNASIEINDDQLKGGLKLITGDNSGETLIINTDDDAVDFSTETIGLSNLDALRFVKDGRAASAKVTIGEAGFRGISDVTGTSSELTISAAAGKSVDLVDSDVTSWSTLSFDKANTIKLDQPVLNQFEDDFGDGVTGELTLEMGETTLNLSKVDFDDKVTTVTVTGTTSADTVTGFSAEDNLALKGVYNLGMGNDRFIGTDKPADFTGTVTVNGGDGNDVITLGERGGGTQIVDGGKGDDRITAGGSSDKLTGGDGADRFTVAMNIIGVEVTDFDGVGADNQDDEYRLDFNVSSKTEFYDLVNRNRLPVLTTNATADGGVAGVREFISPGRALGLGTGALPSRTAGEDAAALTKTAAAKDFLDALTNKEGFYDTEFVLFANADDKLIAFVVTAIEGKEDSITAEEISMVTIGELGDTGVIGESDLILI